MARFIDGLVKGSLHLDLYCSCCRGAYHGDIRNQTENCITSSATYFHMQVALRIFYVKFCLLFVHWEPCVDKIATDIVVSDGLALRLWSR